MTKSIQFHLNGKPVVATCRPDTTVLEWLRTDALLRGTKEGCAEGDCGACSILIRQEDKERYSPANSCIMLMGQVEGANLYTVEGLAALNPNGHPIQELMAKNGSSQCGFCTPGIVCALAGLLERTNEPTEQDIHDALAGNLCRCTGYRPIVEAAREAARNSVADLQVKSELPVSDRVGNEDCKFHIPKQLSELLELYQTFPDAVLLAGGTDVSLDVAHARARWPIVISTRHVKELRTIVDEDDTIEFGGAVSWDDALPYLHKYWPSFATLVRRFGSTQIRAMGTMAGNLANASPIGDGAPALWALGAEVVVTGRMSQREVPISEFFKGYRQPDLRPGEIIKSVKLNKPRKSEIFRVYKISKRYDQDISTVCAAFNVQIEDNVVTEARMAFGGMAATTTSCQSAQTALIGRSLEEDTVKTISKILKQHFAPMSDMRGEARYRAELAGNLFERFALDITGEITEVMAL